MGVQRPTSGTAPEATGASKNIPRTPPYTPHRTKRRFERSDSPASVTSIPPAETTSPAKKVARRSVPDNVKVEELVEGDLGYVSDVEVVYPEELEEKASSASENGSSDDDDEKHSDTGITQRFQELACEDNDEAEFEKKRRESHLRNRTNSRLFKRTHSQSIKSDSEKSDAEAKGDHDLSSSARRLRRRIRGPSGVEVFDDPPRSSPEPRSAGLAAPFQMCERMQRQAQSSDSSSESESDDEGVEVHGTPGSA